VRATDTDLFRMANRHRRAFDPRWLLLCLCLGAAPAAADEIYRWTDANGNVHFGNRKPAGQHAETTQGGLVNQAGGTPAAVVPAAAVAKPADKQRTEDRAARLKRLQRENRQSEKRSSGSGPVILSGGLRQEDPMKNESHCKAVYGKSCDELANWREKAIEDCENKGSVHCKDARWIDKQAPKTLEEQRVRQEERRDNARARYNREMRAMREYR
jgi:hypothetical protein